MNCNPNENAFIISCGGCTKFGWLVGHVCKTINYYDGAWDVELSSEDMRRWAEQTGGKCPAIIDSCLRPIRPDETPEQSIEAMNLLTQIPQKEKV